MNIINPKVFPLPIGLANSQWKHGNLTVINEIYNLTPKSKNIYFNFQKSTNVNKRNDCYDNILKLGISGLTKNHIMNISIFKTT